MIFIQTNHPAKLHHLPQFGIRNSFKKLVVSLIFCIFISDLQQVAELFCIIDEFCKHFDAENARNLLEDNNGMKRRRRAAS